MSSKHGVRSVNTMPATVQFAQKAIIFDDNQAVLLVARLDDDGTFLRWELPGGRVAPREELDAGLRREVWEEVGLEVEAVKPVHLWTWVTDNGVQIVAAALLVNVKSGHISESNRNPDEGLGEIRWISRSRVDLVRMDDDTRTAIVQAGLSGML